MASYADITPCFTSETASYASTTPCFKNAMASYADITRCFKVATMSYVCITPSYEASRRSKEGKARLREASRRSSLTVGVECDLSPAAIVFPRPPRRPPLRLTTKKQLPQKPLLCGSLVDETNVAAPSPPVQHVSWRVKNFSIFRSRCGLRFRRRAASLCLNSSFPPTWPSASTGRGCCSTHRRPRACSP